MTGRIQPTESATGGSGDQPAGAELDAAALASDVQLLLDPHQLSAETVEAVREILKQGSSANTERSYRADLRYWQVWFEARYGQQLQPPVSAAAVVQFIVDHAWREDEAGDLVHGMPVAIEERLIEAGRKRGSGPPALATLLHRLAVLSALHTIQGLENPVSRGEVRELIRKVRRAYAKRGALPRKRPALTPEPLEAMLQTCDDSLIGKRDRALLLFAFASGGRRRSEVAGATMENLARVGDAYVYNLAVSKANQSGTDLPSNSKPVTGRAAAALEDWLIASGVLAGPIFRRVRRGGHVGDALAPAAVNDIVKQRARAAGLSEEFTAHSLRHGFVAEAMRQRVPLTEAMAMSGHSSMKVFAGYAGQAPLDGPGARLREARPETTGVAPVHVGNQSRPSS